MEIFNQKYINIVKNFSGKITSSLENYLNASQDELTVNPYSSGVSLNWRLLNQV